MKVIHQKPFLRERLDLVNTYFHHDKKSTWSLEPRMFTLFLKKGRKDKSFYLKIEWELLRAFCFPSTLGQILLVKLVNRKKPLSSTTTNSESSGSNPFTFFAQNFIILSKIPQRVNHLDKLINFLNLQGDLDEARKDKDSKCVFITVHDIGSNHRSMVVSKIKIKPEKEVRNYQTIHEFTRSFYSLNGTSLLVEFL